MIQKVRAERDGRVLIVLIDNPPINAGSIEVRKGLLDALADLDRDDTLDAAVLIGAGTTFIAGSDLREFGKPLEDPQLPAVIAAIEACRKPVIAALHGAALGGGFELALGCDGRVASPDAVVGLPEVTLGMIPGAGGTQRLPRLIGIPRAIHIVCSGERVPAARALEMGMIDAVADGDLRGAAVAYALGLDGRKRRVRDLPVPDTQPSIVEAAAKAATKAGKGRPQVVAAVDAVERSATLFIDEGLADERAVFQRLRLSREAFALRHQFFAERDAGKRPELEGAVPRASQVVAVVGAGTMGTGIAIAALDGGCDVILLEQDDTALTRGTGRLAQHYADQVSKGRLDAAAAAARQSRLLSTTDWERVGDADVVIEAVFEELDVKRSVFERLDRLARPGAVLASNTSYLDLDAIAAVTRRPGDVVGLHFFSPANVMRLVEVVRGKETAPDAVATGLALAKRLRKLPVVTGNAFGFVGNRIYAAYRRQCEFLLEEGAYPEDVDAALQAFGFAMGPFAVADMSGLDIAWRMRRAQAGTRDPKSRYVDIPDRLCEAGRLGRKSGAGYYRYDAGQAKGEPDATVHQLIDAATTAKGIVRRDISADEIQRRALLAIVNEAALVIAEGIASRATDIDVVLVNGYGFPRWEGGPVFWARERGRERLEADIDWLAEVAGSGFVRADLASLFKA